MTQRELSIKSGVGVRLLIELERGKPSAQLGKALSVLNALGLRLFAEMDAPAAVDAVATPTERSRG